MKRICNFSSLIRRCLILFVIGLCIPLSANADAAEGTFRVNDSGNITKNGTEMSIQCGAWFGLEGQHEPPDAEYNPGGAPLELYVGNMWWNPTGRTIEQTMTEIKAQGFNVVRLPIAPQTLDATDPQGIGWAPEGGVLKNDPSVQQENSRQALEDFIKLADENDIDIIIDIHSCSNYVGWRAGRLDAKPPYVDADREGYVYTREEHSCSDTDNPSSVTTVAAYNKSLWLDDLREIAGLPEQLGVDNILAIDIFNEPWDYTWSEWKELAESAYEAISEVNDDVLIIVEGIGSELSDDTQIPHGDEASNPNWGENFYPAADDPLDIPKERLVLSPHTYGPSVFVQKQFMDPSQEECTGLEGDEAGDADCNIVIDADILEAGWQEHFGYLRDQGYAMIIGEFGGNMSWPEGASTAEQTRWSHITPGVDAQWQNALVDYAIKQDIDACYWSINPESADTGGLYGTTYVPETNESGWGTWTEIDTDKMELLQRLWESSPESTTEETTEPVAEETTEPVVEETTEPAAEETTEPVAEETTEPIAEETTEPIAEETTEPAAEETTEPAAEETTEPATEEATDATTDTTKSVDLQAEVESSAVHLTWTLNNITPMGVEVYRDTDSNPAGRGRIGWMKNGNEFVDEDVTPGVTYYYWIKATEADWNVTNSSAISATVSSDTN
jgi:aryl-phospho-beta-D-glucosidase BglC (GH1 family)